MISSIQVDMCRNVKYRYFALISTFFVSLTKIIDSIIVTAATCGEQFNDDSVEGGESQKNTVFLHF